MKNPADALPLRAFLRKPVVQRALDFLLLIVGELEPVSAKELDPVVGKRVVGSGYHDP